MKKTFSRIIIKGGVLSPAELKQISEMAEISGSNTISLGSRQDILLVNEVKGEAFNEAQKFQIIPPGATGSDNIVSSYVSADILPQTSWLTGNGYLYVLEQFRRQPNLKINITDPRQRLVPLFTGHLNFIASEHVDYWFLYIKLPGWKELEIYPALIYSWDIAKVAEAIEGILQEEPETVEMIFILLSEVLNTNNRTLDKVLEVPFHPFPYYEGMNKIGLDNYWLGLYWRNNKYDTDFLKAMCDLCAVCKIGKISITPWKSLIIKGIPKEFKLEWEKFLGKRGINVRHSMLELNWHLPVNNHDALELKKYLVAKFDQNDISTYGLTFGIHDYTRKTSFFTAIVIEKNKTPEELEKIKIRESYNLLYARNFDPNTREYIIYVQDVDKVELPALLMELSKMYFDQLGDKNTEETNPIKPEKEVVNSQVNQCRNCLNIYDPAYGDMQQNIEPGVKFEDLPKDYVCPLCEAPKANFEEIIFEKQVE